MSVVQHDIKRQKRKKGKFPSRISIALLPDVSFAAVRQSPTLLINHGPPHHEEQSDHTDPSYIPEVTSVGQEQDEDPGYSTIQELSRECGSSLGPAPTAISSTVLPAKSAKQEVEEKACFGSSPLTPSKHLGDIYSKFNEKAGSSELLSYSASENPTPWHSPENLYAKPHKRLHKKDVSTNTNLSESCLREQLERCSNSQNENVSTSPSKESLHQLHNIDSSEQEDAFNVQVNQLETWKQMKLENKITCVPPKLAPSFHQYGILESSSAVDRSVHTEFPKLRSGKNETLKEKIGCLQNYIHELNMELRQYLYSRNKVLVDSNSTLSWQDEIKLLSQTVRELIEENKELHQQRNVDKERGAGWMKECESKSNQVIHLLEENTMLREQNRQLKENLVQCEYANKREMETLATELASLQMEKVQITGDLKRAQEKHPLLQRQYQQLSKEKENLSSRHMAFVQESHRLLEELKRKYREELNKALDQMKADDERNCQLFAEVEELKRNIKILQEQKTNLLETHQRTIVKCENLTSLLQESQLQKSQLQELLDGLLQIAEHATSERDIVVKKSQSEEGHHQYVLSSVLDHSLIVGRLQEHIKNYKLKAAGDLKKAEARAEEKNAAWEVQKQEYERQLHSLRTMVVKEQEALNIIQDEKRHLELDLEALWQVISEDSRITKEKIQLLTA